MLYVGCEQRSCNLREIDVDCVRDRFSIRLDVPQIAIYNYHRLIPSGSLFSLIRLGIEIGLRSSTFYGSLRESWKLERKLVRDSYLSHFATPKELMLIRGGNFRETVSCLLFFFFFGFLGF